VGLDVAPAAIERATARARAEGSRARFVTGDVARLADSGVTGSFDLVLDIGCYHAVPDRLRDAYAAGVAAVTRQGAAFWLAGVGDPPVTWRLLGAHGVGAAELRRRFGGGFRARGGTVGQRGRASEGLRPVPLRPHLRRGSSADPV
jgi:SAM-dependent methyltransferase